MKCRRGSLKIMMKDHCKCTVLIVMFVILCLQETWAFLLPMNFVKTKLIRVRSEIQARQMGTKDYVLDFVGLVNKFGYPGEVHKVVTEDGYILRFHRIPGNSVKNAKVKGKPVVFIQHGFLASSDTWVLQGPKRDLAYILADSGYDVWVGNVRGNTYSRSHARLNPDRDPEFWKFSFQESGLYDIPAMIDYVLKKTNQSSLVYVGHSMGTTMSYVMLSSKPEYNEKIRLLVSLSPVAFWHAELTPFYKVLVNNYDFIKNFLRDSKIYELMPQTIASRKLMTALCRDGSLFQKTCLSFFFEAFGSDPEQTRTEDIPLAFTYYPAGTSTQNLIHFGQNMMSGEFQAFDHGPIGNLKAYNQENPPLFNVSNIRIPVALFYGRADNIVNIKDVQELRSKLPNCQVMEEVPYKRFNHFDFLYARDVKFLLQDRVKEIIDESLYNVTSLR